VPATRRACIDVGSISTALLVADLDAGELTPVDTCRAYTQLAASLGPEGFGREKIDEVVAAVDGFRLRAAELGSVGVELVATQAVRRARDADQLGRALVEATGIKMEVIDGHAEARYSFIGAVGGLHRVRATTVVIDPGGGSTEISHCVPGGQPVTASFAVGSTTLRRRFIEADPPLPEEMQRVRSHAEQCFAELDVPEDVALALAVGGGATTARELTGGVIDKASLGRALSLTMSMPSDRLAERLGIAADRARLVPAGLVIFDVLADQIAVGIEVGRGGLREGLLLDRHSPY
jgi:exopolyphosphatase/guanosine-5'-triphosphate,3'-diphosphate pyrophosphatase